MMSSSLRRLCTREIRGVTVFSKENPLREGRARAGPTFHRHFERPGPLDPRYQMIEHLAPKFISTSLARSAVHEPRAAFLLNRFSQTLPILYATHAAEFVLSCNPDTAVGRSFYEYIDEAYLLGAVNAIERAKENDSIAYLRLLWKISLPEPRAEEDEEMRYEGDDSIEREHARRSMRSRSYQRPPVHPFPERHEVECLVSASSDGLVVVVRHAPPIEGLAPHVRPPGVFASPWATSPLAPYTTIPPPLSEAYPLFANASPEYPRSVPGPSNQDVMNSIRDVTAFTWSISMLNDDVSQDNAADMVHGDGASDNDNLPAPQ